MRLYISAQWERLRTSYWFIPTLLCVGAISLSFLTVHVDTILEAKWVRTTGWIWAGGPEGARNVLATIAGSTITVAGVVFSITIVALTLASSQFGPRLLRNFMADRPTQVVLGVFVSTFLYCLLVLRTVRGRDDVTFVPFLSITFGLVLGVASVGFLIFFIHHVANSILAENLIARVAGDLNEGVCRLFPEQIGEGEREIETEANRPSLLDEEPHEIPAKRSGYIQAIGAERALALAQERGLIIRFQRRPGDFVAEGTVLAEVWPRLEAVDPVSDQLADLVMLGRHRTPTEDLEYSIDQLVEVAVRSMSPGINDPFTAISCVEWLGAALVEVAGRKMPSRYRYDKEGALRVIADVTDFDGIAAAALNQVRQHGCTSVALTIRLLEILRRVAPKLQRARDRAALAEHAGQIHADGLRHAKNEIDRREIEEHFAATSEALEKTRARIEKTNQSRGQ